MDLTSWPTGITVEIPPGRIVALRSTLSSLPDLATSMNALANAGGKLLNFDNRAAIFRIDPDALLAFSGLHITGVPPKSLYLQDPTNSAQPLPYTLATFPSVLAGVKSGIMHNFTTVDYYPDIDCSEETLNEVVFRSGIALRNASAAGIVPGAAAVYLLGAGMFRFPVLDPLQGNSTVGDALSFVNNTVRNCINGIEADGGGGGNGGLPVWAWVLIALGILFAVTLVLKVCFVKLYRHRRRRRELHLRRRPHPLATIPPATLSLSATLYLEGKALVVADSLVADQMDLSAAATMNIDVAALKKLRDAWKDRIGRVHGLEFEAMVGRGAFGAVYKSKWRGNTVATKLIEHTIDSKMTFYIQREAVLATTCSHPNLVMTYKVATAGISDLEKLPHFLEVSAEEAAAAAAAGAATAAGEGTEQDEKRADGLEIAEEIELVRLSGDEDAGPSGSRYAAAAARPEIAPQAEEEDEEAEWCLKESSDYYFKTHRTDKSISDLEAGKIGGGGGGRQAGGSAGSLRKIPEDLVATLIIMEYCDLGSVREALYSSRAYDIPGCSRDPISLLRTLLDVALGLDYLHNVARVVHGDVKPGNVMLKSVGNTRRGWMAKLVDFGAARALENGISPLALGKQCAYVFLPQCSSKKIYKNIHSQHSFFVFFSLSFTLQVVALAALQLVAQHLTCPTISS